MKNQPLPSPPGHLGASGTAFWQEVVERYDLEPHDLHRLVVACDAIDLMEAARGQIAADGLTVKAGKDGVKSHPAVGVWRDASKQFLSAVRQAGLDLEEADARLPRLAQPARKKA